MLIVVFDLTILVQQGSFDVYQLTEHGVKVLDLLLLLLFNYFFIFIFL